MHGMHACTDRSHGFVRFFPIVAPHATRCAFVRSVLCVLLCTFAMCGVTGATSCCLPAVVPGLAAPGFGSPGIGPGTRRGISVPRCPIGRPVNPENPAHQRDTKKRPVQVIAGRKNERKRQQTGITGVRVDRILLSFIAPYNRAHDTYAPRFRRTLRNRF